MVEKMSEAYEEYYQTVYKFLTGLTTGDYDLAEELTQETFYRATKNIGKFRGECKMSTWLCQIARYTFYQYVDKKNRRKEVVSLQKNSAVRKPYERCCNATINRRFKFSGNR